jgi:CRP-like cAMP-binding protein
VTQRNVEELRPFRALPPEEVAELERMAARVHFDLGQPVFRQGEPADHALLLIDGRFSVSVDTDRGPRAVGDVWPGEVVGESALFLPGATRNANVLAEVSSIALLIDEDFLTRARGTRALCTAQKHLMATSARRIRATNLAMRKAWQQQRAEASATQDIPSEGKAGFRQRLSRILGGIL